MVYFRTHQGWMGASVNELIKEGNIELKLALEHDQKKEDEQAAAIMRINLPLTPNRMGDEQS